MLALGMEAYSRRLLAVCSERGAECLDLASMLPKDTRTFYDDVHLTEEGSRAVAEELTRHLVRTPPLCDHGRYNRM